MAALVLCGLLMSCAGEGRPSLTQPDSSSPGGPSPTFSSGGSETPAAEAPPLKPLESDDPNGPEHARSFESRPSGADLAEVSRTSDTRRSAEEFAILFNHALEDRSPASAGSEAVATFTVGLTPQEITWIEESRPALVEDAQVVPGSRSWIRSVVQVEASTAVDVYLVEKAKALFSASQADPLVYWSRARVSLIWTDGRWVVTDYKSAVASEGPRFSPGTWDVIMDRGVGWRRFTNE